VWASYVNATGGVAGHPIQAIAEDSGSDPNKALSEVQDLYQNHHIIALVADMSPLTNAGFRSYVEKVGLPVIGGDCGSVTWNLSPLFYPTCAQTDTAYREIAQLSKTRGDKFAFMYCLEAQTCAEGKTDMVDRGYARQAGLTLVYSAQISLTQVDFTSQCLAMKSAGATVVDLVADPSTVQRAGTSCSRQGYNPIWVQSQASVSATSQQLPGLGNLAVQNSVFPFAGVSGVPAIDEFKAAFAKYDPGEVPGPANANGWAASELFAKLVTIAAQTNPTITSPSLRQAATTLHGETLGGLTAPMTFPAGQPAPDVKCYFVTETSNGGAWVAPDGDKPRCVS
jgi:branched-chain amino acid transport system substrate-binding protein